MISNHSKLVVDFLRCMLPVGLKPFGLKKYTYSDSELVKKRYRKRFLRQVTVHSVLGSPFSPIMQVEDENKVIRTSKNKAGSYVILENKGLIQPTVKFSLSDRKGMGASSNKRQLSVLYKVNCNYFKRTLNTWLTNGLNKPLSEGKFLKVENQTQTFEGYIDNIPLTVVVTPSDFIDERQSKSDTEDPPVLGSIAEDGGDKYLKVVTYKFINAYNNKIQELNRLGVGTGAIGGVQRTSLGGGGAFNPFLTPVTGGNVIINQDNWLASRGLFGSLPSTRIFRGPENQNIMTSSNGEILKQEPVLAGRFMLDPPQLGSESIEDPFSTVRKNVIYHFNGFSTLPVNLKLLQLDNFSTSLNEVSQAASVVQVTQAQSENPLIRGFQSITSPIFGTENPNPKAQTAIQSLNTFLLDFPLYTVARQKTNQNNSQPLREISLTITSRKTNYTTNIGGLNESPVALSQSPFIFEYFEDERKYERAYVSMDFLGAALDKALLNYVRQTQSMRVVYNSIFFGMYAKKEWNKEPEKEIGSITKKVPLVSLGEKEAFFESLVGGTNERDLVNLNTNLIFTAQFNHNITSVCKTNRFITCSAYAEQVDLKSIEARNLWKKLEEGFGQTIILSYYPYVALEPAFTRGKIIETSDQVFFNGLVSNAGRKNSFLV